MLGLIKSSKQKNKCSLEVNSKEKNKLKVEIQPFQLSRLLHNITTSISSSLEEYNNVVHYNVKSHLGRYIIGNHTHIEQILKTLLLRSCVLSKNTEIFLNIAEDKNKCLIFSITNKKGLLGSEEDNRYMQNNRLLFNKSKIIANTMDGQIKFKSSWLSGTVFTFTTPYYEDKNNRSKKETLKTVLLGKKALFISDCKHDIKNIEYMFKTFGIHLENMPLAQFEKKKPDLNYYDVVLVRSKDLGSKHISFFKNFYKNDQSQLKIILMHEFVEQYEQKAWMQFIAHAELFGPAIIGDIEEILYNLFVMKSQAEDTINNIEVFSMDRFEIVENAMLAKENFIIYKGTNLAIVQNDVRNRRKIERMLTIDGFFLHFVDSGIEMLKLLKREKIDLIFTDIGLPLMNGYEMTEKIRQNEYWKNIPVIAVSFSFDDNSMKKMSLSGMNAVIPKYYTEGHVYTALERFLFSKQKERLESGEEKVKDYKIQKKILDVKAGVKYAGSTLAYKKSLIMILKNMDDSIDMMGNMIQNRDVVELQRFVESSLVQYSKISATSICDMLRELNVFLRNNQAVYLEEYIIFYSKHLKRLKIEIDNYIEYIDSWTYKVLS